MNDMASVIIPKSDQINADDLIAGPITITITGVSIRPGQEQPISISFEGDNGTSVEEAFVSGRALAPDSVRLAVFKSRRGGRGYREASVDAFLDRVVELLVVATV